MLNNNDRYLFPDIIKNLPEIDVHFKGVRGWVSQGKDHQVVFFDIEPIGEITSHSHCAQWGIVIEGEMDLTIGGLTKTYKRGDSYFIPEDVVHSAVFKRRTLAIDFFADENRYSAKE